MLCLICKIIEFAIVMLTIWAFYELITKWHDDAVCDWKVWLTVLICINMFTFLFWFVLTEQQQLWLISLRDLLGLVAAMGMLIMYISEKNIAKQYHYINYAFITAFAIQLIAIGRQVMSSSSRK